MHVLWYIRHSSAMSIQGLIDGYLLLTMQGKFGWAKLLPVGAVITRKKLPSISIFARVKPISVFYKTTQSVSTQLELDLTID